MILALLILRFSLVTGFRLLLGQEPGWSSTVYDVGTYLLVAVLLVKESHSLPDYHINTFAIWLLILSKPIQTIYLNGLEWLKPPIAFPDLHTLFIWMIALVLLVYFRSRLFQNGAVQWWDLKWALLGVLAGLVVALCIAYPMSFLVTQLPPGNRNSLTNLVSGIISIPYQIGYAAASEEPVFRGFLWGYLRKIGWRDVWIWLFQAGLFGLAHLYYLDSMPFMFWFGVPLGALVLGWLAWRSRSIASSMLAHGVMNGLGYLMSLLIAAFRLG